MREIVSSVTSKGQVTIPAEVRRLLGVEARGKVAFVFDGDGVRIARRGSVIARTAGAVKGTKPALTIRQIKEATARAIAEDAVRGMNS